MGTACGAPTATATPISDPVVVYPNPFDVYRAVGGELKIKNLPPDATVEIYSISLALVVVLKEKNGVAYWNGENKYESLVAVGKYPYVVRDSAGKVLKQGMIIVYFDSR